MLAPLRSRLARPALALLVPLALATGAYSRVLDGEFQFDDTHTVERNLAVKDLGGYVRHHLAGEILAGQRPVTSLTFALNYAVGGLVPWNYHLTNLVIHLLAVVLAWALALEVLRLAGAARAEWIAVAVAGAFALHPLQSEAVSYVSQRSEALASALYVATLLLLLAAERRGLRRRAAPLWAAAFACFVLALGAKPIAMTVPAAWLLLAAVVPAPERRRELLRWPRRLLAAAPFVALDVFLMARTLGATAGNQDAGFSVPGLTPWTYLATELRAIVVYLRLLAWPAGQNVDWDFPRSESLLEPAVILSGAFLLALAAGAVALAVRARREPGEGGGAARVAAFGVLWFFLVLSVTSSVVPLADVLVEHRVYLASWGAFVAVAVALERLLARAPARVVRPAALAAVALAWAPSAAALAARNGVWETRRALWTDCVSKSPLKARVHLSLGYAALQEGRFGECVESNELARSLTRGDVGMELQILRNLGACYVLLHRLDEAEAVLRSAVDKGYWDADIMNNLAVTLIQKNDLGGAESVARRAIAVAPGKGEAWNTMGEILLRRERAADALPYLEQAIALDPDVPVRHFNRALAIATLGRVPEACAIWGRLAPGTDAGLRLNVRRAWAQHRCDEAR